MNLAATHFFCADEAQFESLNIVTLEEEKEISMTNSKIIKFAKYKTVKLLVNSKSLGKQISHKLLLYKIVYTFALEINFLSI